MKFILLFLCFCLSLQKIKYINLEKYGEITMTNDYNCIFVYIYDDFYDSFSEDNVYLEVSYYWYEYEKDFSLNYTISSLFLNEEDLEKIKYDIIYPNDHWSKESKTKIINGHNCIYHTYEFKFSPKEEKFLFIITDKGKDAGLKIEHVEKYQSFKIFALIFFSIIGIIIIGLLSYLFLVPYIKKKCNKSDSQINEPLKKEDHRLNNLPESNSLVNESE